MRKNLILLISISTAISFLAFDESNSNISVGSCDCDPIRDSLALIEIRTTLTIRPKLGFQDAIDEREGEVLSFNDMWPLHKPLSTWDGISLSNQGCVEEINLFNKSLDGSFPDSAISKLKCLKILNLGSSRANRMFGVSVGGVFGGGEFGQNIFWSEFPKGIIQLEALEVLNLSTTTLSGEIPPELFSLPNIREVNLHNNGHLSSNSLNIDFEKVTEPSNLKILDLSGIGLEGCIPPQIENFSNLTTLNLSRNSLNGEIPTEIGNLKNLKVLNLSQNSHKGLILDKIIKLSQLEEIDLSYNDSLRGFIPTSIGQLKNLESIDLTENNFSGEIPTSIKNLINLEGLYFTSNQFNGRIPKEIGSLKSLRILALSNNNVEGSLPDEIGNLTSLKILNLSNNKLSEEIPFEIGDALDLFEINLANNNFEGKLPITFEKLQQLWYINLSENNFHGEIPEEWSNMFSINTIDLSHNQLSGSLPSSLFLLRNLYLEENFYTLEDFESFTNLWGLHRLDLSSNLLNGQLPESILKLVDEQRTFGLEYLNLSSNQLLGTIPEELINSKVSLILDSNNIDSIPLIQLIDDSREIFLGENKLSFEDIIPNLLILEELTAFGSSRSYSPQKKISEDTIIITNACDSPLLDLKIDSNIKDSEYKWFKDGDSIYVSNINQLRIRDIYNDFEDFDGVYTCQVKNPRVPDLILESGTFTINLDRTQVIPDTTLIKKTLFMGNTFDTLGYSFDCSTPNRALGIPDTLTNCITMYSVNLTCKISPKKRELLIPSAFSPNNDGINETFLIPAIYNETQTYGLIIYNQTGQQVYQQTNYQNNWAGRDSNGKTLPVGTYYYVLKPQNDKVINGTITIVR